MDRVISNYFEIKWGSYYVVRFHTKVGKSQKQIMVFSILPKDERNLSRENWYKIKGLYSEKNSMVMKYPRKFGPQVPQVSE